jgi:hypothetical protein
VSFRRRSTSELGGIIYKAVLAWVKGRVLAHPGGWVRKGAQLETKQPPSLDGHKQAWKDFGRIIVSEDGELLAPATGVTAWPCGDLAPQLVPFKTLCERNFEQCSPSPLATAPTGPYDPRKSPFFTTLT